MPGQPPLSPAQDGPPKGPRNAYETIPQGPSLGPDNPLQGIVRPKARELYADQTLSRVSVCHVVARTTKEPHTDRELMIQSDASKIVHLAALESGVGDGVLCDPLQTRLTTPQRTHFKPQTVLGGENPVGIAQVEPILSSVIPPSMINNDQSDRDGATAAQTSIACGRASGP
ncbi:hypothetical protein DTO169E5_547 [Paecilomyces variotii]|nr:hypothetical protein DTO169E5_547 [Paecilomyces variotii]